MTRVRCDRTDIEIPPSHYVDEAKREAIRDWILTESMETDTVHRLDTSPCQFCQKETFLANRFCHHCQVGADLTIQDPRPVECLW